MPRRSSADFPVHVRQDPGRRGNVLAQALSEITKPLQIPPRNDKVHPRLAGRTAERAKTWRMPLLPTAIGRNKK